MKRRIEYLLLFTFLTNIVSAQVIRPFTPRYSNPSVRGNIVFVSNSIISSAGVSSGIPGTGEIPPAGTTTDNGKAGINIDIDNPAPTTIFSMGANWKWFSNGTLPAINWTSTVYSDAAWASGNGEFGYGDGDETTCIPAASPIAGTLCMPTGTKWWSYYFRKTVNIASLAGVSNFIFNYKRDDGIVVYVNGTEVFRNNMPGGAIANNTPASSTIGGAAESAINTFTLSGTAPFVVGNNIISVEIHQDFQTSSDITFDMELQAGYQNSTFNSSSSDLTIPTTCNKVLFAGLYWGADQGTSGTNLSWMTPAHTTVKFKIPGSPVYQDVVATVDDIHSVANSPGLNHAGYQCFADVTSLVNTNNANGTYTVANVEGPIGINNSCGGWTMVIVYSNPTLLPRNLTVFDGNVIINGGDPAVDVNISGFLTPPSGPVSCELGAVVFDGDRGSTDSFAFKQNGAPAFYNLATTTVPFNNNNDAWNSKITYKNTLVTTRVPAFQNTLGYDASIFDLPNAGNARLSNSQSAATVRFSSPSENYFVQVLTTSISQYNPTFSLSKTSTDINGGIVRAGDSLRYQVNYQNLGNDTSKRTTIIDNIPAGSSYKFGSLRINGIAKTDAAGDDEAEYDFVNNRVVFRVGYGANNTNGGTIGINASGNVAFDVLLSSSCSVLNCLGDSVRNIARMDYMGYSSNVNLYDSSGVFLGGCLTNGPVTNFVSGPCSVPKDTFLINNCPATSVMLPWRRFSGYTFYRAKPFTAANQYNPSIAVTASHVYWAYFNNIAGCADTIRLNVVVTPCPDIDDDNDGIPDYVEFNNPLALQDHNGNGIPNWNDPAYPGYVDNNIDNVNDNFDWGADSDNDGIPNFQDTDFWIPFVDVNGDGVNDNADMDLDGIPNQYDRDSDNDGIPDTVESYGVDTDGDGVIDNYIDTDNDGFSQNVDANNTGVNGSGTGLGAQDLDGDGIPNYLDLDSDNDGIPDVVEALGADANNDGKLDNFIDTDGDGLNDSVDGDVGNDDIAENAANGLLLTGPDTTPIDGRADSYPYKNMDQDKRANPYDLDSDMDGITDVIEAGFTDANFDGMVDGPRGADGWNIAINNQASLGLRNTDAMGKPDYLDIDADDDGIPDNIEGQTTLGYKFPTYLDTDNDGIDNAYDAFVGFGGSGIFVADKDGDGIPDYRDLDTDSDGVPDIVEGNDFNLNGVADDDVALTYLDTDGDGLDNKFDSINSVTNIKGTSYMMGTSGSTSGDPMPGTRSPVQKRTVGQPERDWRYVSYVLPLDLLQFGAALSATQVNLNWDIISPLYLDVFEIERSIDNVSYENVSQLSASVPINTLKRFTAIDDISTLNATFIFYRLKVTAKNGQVRYSEVAVIKRSDNKLSLRVFPNPAKDVVSLNFYSEVNAEAVFVIKDVAGKIVKQVTHKVQKGNNNITISGLAALANGLYNLQVMAAGEVKTQKLLLNN